MPLDTHIIHWNIRGFRSNYQHLRLLLSHTNAVVVCLQESRMPVPPLAPPRGFQLYHQPGPPGQDDLDYGGSCILVKDQIGHMSLPLTTDLQAIAIRCHLDHTYTICSLYVPPHFPLRLEQLEHLIQQLPAPFLLLGDFNARHPIWGDSVSNSKGLVLEQLLGTGLCGILNGDFPTHFHAATNSTSCVDLSLCSPELLPDFSWSVSRDLYNSDHFPVRLSLPDQTPHATPTRFQYHRANWACFRQAAACIRLVSSFCAVDDAVDYFNTTIISAAELSIPKSSGVARTRPVPWWNAELAAAHSAKKTAMRRYYCTRLLADKLAFNRA